MCLYQLDKSTVAEHGTETHHRINFGETAMQQDPQSR